MKNEQKRDGEQEKEREGTRTKRKERERKWANGKDMAKHYEKFSIQVNWKIQLKQLKGKYQRRMKEKRYK